MKLIILFTALGLFCFHPKGLAQQKVERFCEVTLSPKNGFTTKQTASISFGEVDSLFYFRDSSVLANLQKVNSMKTATDVLNYMSNLGWTLVSVIPFGIYTSHERLYFRKSFDESELGSNR